MRVTLVLGTLVLVAIGLSSGALAVGRTTTLTPGGIGAMRFGLAKARAVGELSALLGAPAAHGVNTGCSPRYTEVEWGDLVAEFRSNTFSGYRYVAGGYPVTTPGSPREFSPPRSPTPHLATAQGISLGSTLAQLRVAYGGLRFIGTDRWRSPNGLVFVDDAEHSPESRASRLIEIKVGTCGDF